MFDNNGNVAISVLDDESDDHGRLRARARPKRKKLLHRGENGFALRLLRKLLRYWMLLIIIPVAGFLVFEAFIIGTKPSLTVTSQLGTPNDPSQLNSEFSKVDQSTATLKKDPKSNLNQLDPTARVIGGVRQRSCPSNCSGNGKCLSDRICECKDGYTGIDCSTADCDEQCSLHGGVCDNGVCEFRCSDYAGYKCQNSSTLLSILSLCKNVLGNDFSGRHCAPSEPSVLQQLEEVVACLTTSAYSLAVLGNFLIYSAALTVAKLLNGLPAGYRYRSVTRTEITGSECGVRSVSRII